MMLLDWKLSGSILLVITTIATATTTASCKAPPAHASWAATTKWRCQSEVDVLLTVDANEIRWDVANLLANTNVALANESSRVMDRLGKTELENLGLKTTLHDFGSGQTKHVIQLLLVLQEQTKLHHTAQQRLTFEQPPLILLVKGKQRTSGCADAGEGILNAPHLTLVLQAIFANDLHLCIQTLLLEGSLWLTESFAIVRIFFDTHLGCCSMPDLL